MVAADCRAGFLHGDAPLRIVGLRRRDVDLLGKRIMLPQTKNGEGRIVYLNQFAMTAMESVLGKENFSASSCLFPSITPDQVTTAFRRVCAKLEIENFRFYDLRHTAASWMRMSGSDTHTAGMVLGQKDPRMAARY